MESKIRHVIPKYIGPHGVPIRKWLFEHPRFRTHIIRNMDMILQKIRRRYPSFRHMDLHANNVTYYRGRLCLSHFEHARLDSSIPVSYDLDTFIGTLDPLAADIAMGITS
jgi:hypothetical protein